MAALAVVLIVGGALASGWLALQTGDRADYLFVDAEVAQGEPIDDGDLDEISLPEDMAAQYVLSSERDDIVGMEATTRLEPGTILHDNMLTDDAGSAPGEAQVSLQPATIPDGTTDGSPVLVFLTNSDREATAVPATVVSIDSPESEEITSNAAPTVTVSIPTECGGAVALASADDEIQIQLYNPGDRAPWNDCALPVES